MTVVLGLDLSLTAAAAVAVPLDYDGDFRRIVALVVGEKLRRDATDAERARRTETIAARLVRFALENRAAVAYVEGYAFSQRTAAHALAELGGVVRLELVRAGIDVQTANVGSARKLLLGKVPRQDAKVAVAEAFRAAGAPLDWSLDETDAMACANLGCSLLGGYCFAMGERAA